MASAKTHKCRVRKVIRKWDRSWAWTWSCPDCHSYGFGPWGRMIVGAIEHFEMHRAR